MISVDLICVGAKEPCSNIWNLGQVYAVEESAVVGFIKDYVASTTSEACLFWDYRLPWPNPSMIGDVLALPGDLWHAGLRFGLQSYPRVLQYVRPGWVLGRAVSNDSDSTSWRVSLRACLVKTSVLKKVGGPYDSFKTLDAAALEWGYRCVMHGVVTRYVARLLPETSTPLPLSDFPLEDELRFLNCNHKTVWTRWAAARLILANPLRAFQVLSNYHTATNCPCDATQRNFSHVHSEVSCNEPLPGITVILPTRRRYAYLRNCLLSLRKQTIPITEVICVDQNPPEARDPELYTEFGDLPLRVIWQDARGQSTARNAALREVKTDWIFFADDDSEYPPDTLEQHLRLIFATQADGSTGVSLPPFEYSLPPEFQYVRVASNFDTGNALVKTKAVLKAGGFDLNFDFGKGADSDLGMRLYLDGALLMHNPEAKRLHYKAETGGLREYGVLWETKVKNRFQPWPSPTYLYWLMTYFPPIQVREKVIQTFLHRLSSERVVEFVLLPVTIFQFVRSRRIAKEIYRVGPKLFSKQHNYPA